MKTSKLPFRYEVKEVQNGYHVQIISADDFVVGTLYGTTNPMWDCVSGANEVLGNAELIINAVNKLNETN